MVSQMHWYPYCLWYFVLYISSHFLFFFLECVLHIITSINLTTYFFGKKYIMIRSTLLGQGETNLNNLSNYPVMVQGFFLTLIALLTHVFLNVSLNIAFFLISAKTEDLSLHQELWCYAIGLILYLGEIEKI